MTDPVDTDALRRDARVLAPGFPGVEKRLNAAADEVDQLRADVAMFRRIGGRLRAVIEDAPHAPKCIHYAGAWQTIGEPCTCWKADAL